MVAYVVANVDVLEPEPYKGYSALVPPTVIEHGGWYVGRARGTGDAKVLEGDFEPGRFVILGFESKEAAEGWYYSEAYQKAAEVRRKYATSAYFLIEEVPDGEGAPTREWGPFR